jgi:hypothetical protein
MSSSESESESDWSETSAVESDADRIRRNDKSLSHVNINAYVDDIETLDALKNNTVVTHVTYYTFATESLPVNLNHEALCVELSERNEMQQVS